MSDTALESLEKLNDLSQWEGVKYNVPVFVEHELWEVPHPFVQGETTRVAILPGQPKPSVGKMLYAIGVDDLTKIAGKITNRYKDSGNPMKIFVGHTNLKLPQSEQPKIIGYGCGGAKVGPSGPKKRLAVLVDRLQYRKGCGKEAEEYPERSPEFDPLKGELTGLALLKTDPKLPMGLVTYSSTVAGYEGEFRGVVATYASDNVTVLYGRQLAENDPKAQDDRRQSATGPDPSAPPNATELQGEEAALADRFMRHYERTNPVIRYMCGKYAQDQQAQQEPIGVEQIDGGEESQGTEQDGEQHSEKPPGMKPGEKPQSEVHMANDVLPVQYAQLAEEVKGLKASLDAQNKATEGKLATLMATNQDLSQKYAQEQSKRILTELVTEGFVIKAPAKEIERMTKLDDAGRVEYANNIRENYAKAEVAPVGPMIGIFDEPVAIPGTKEKATSEEVDKVVIYSEKHKIDLDENGAFEKCLAEIRKTA